MYMSGLISCLNKSILDLQLHIKPIQFQRNFQRDQLLIRQSGIKKNEDYRWAAMKRAVINDNN